MVTNVTSLTGNGLKDWLIQRVTAIYMAVYTLYFAVFFFRHPQVTYDQWLALFSCPWFIGASAIALLAFILHAWIGIWTVTTDYLKCTVMRLSIQMGTALLLLGQLIWGLMILWGRG